MQRHALVTLLLPFLASVAIEVVPAAETPPNVVIILADDQAWGDYSFMGHEAIQTARLDQLAKESLTFTRGYVPDSLCRPSLATIITGLYPHQHGIVGNDPPFPQAVAGFRTDHARNSPEYLAQRIEYLKHIDDDPKLPELLKAKGYVSHQSGKWWEGNFTRGGFTHGMTHGDRTRGGRHGDDGLKIGRTGMQPVFDFIDTAQKEEKPFFVWYAPFMPHTPHTPPERLLKKYREKTPHEPIAKYWAMCEWFDETCGQLLDHLDEHDLADNTIVVYVCDNGWINEEESSAYKPKSKRSQYDGGVRTPIMVRWPGHAEPRIDREHLASSIDIAPTILKAIGLPVPKEMTGIDLLDAKAVAGRDAIFGEIFEHDIVDMIDPVPSLRFRWIIDGNWKLIVPHPAREPDAPVELYDLAKDPSETRNLAAENPLVVGRLQKRLNDWWAPHARKVAEGTTPISAPVVAASIEPEATDPAALKIAEGFAVERLYTVPKETQGSWVSLAVGPNGTLFTCDQYGGLYRVTPPRPGGDESETKVESIDVEIGAAQGLLWAFDSLYVVVNGSSGEGPGLYRVRDTNADGELDTVELLQKLPTIRMGVEHGPHGIVLSPDGRSLYVVAGNMTSLPPVWPMTSGRGNWDEDQLLPRAPASNGHATNLLAPGGWVCKTDLDGKAWELVATGMRNPYDIAFDRHGELFTYDADMEMDIGTPWYRPTRICHVVPGGEFGWRYGTGKWPADYPDSLPAVVDVGLGSPTGVTFGFDARNFPPRYRNALFACDWTYGRMFAVHLTPEGASYTGEIEEFLSGVPLPLTDVVVHPADGAMYFTIGGRKVQSGLYRVTYTGAAAPSDEAVPPLTDEARRRRRIEQLSAIDGRGVVLDGIAAKGLAHADRHVRYAAATALEQYTPEKWVDEVLGSAEPDAVVAGVIALARLGEKDRRIELLEALGRLDWSQLDDRQRVELLRAFGLVMIRLGGPSAEEAAVLRAPFESRFPTPNAARRVDEELVRLLVFLGSPKVVRPALDLAEAARTQEEKLFHVMVLRVAEAGWTPELRRRYFALANDAESRAGTGEYVGGGHYQTYVQMFRTDAVNRLPEAERAALADVIAAQLPSAVPSGSPTPRPFVRNWSEAELAESLGELERGRDFERGRTVFTDASCIACHRFDNRGGILAPDVTAAGKRYSPRDMLREILDPSKVVSDQYRTHVVVTSRGKVYEGRILDENDRALVLATDPRQPRSTVVIPIGEVEEKVLSRQSMMPNDLLNTFEREEILDLLAYIRSGGDATHPAFGGE